jgi:hypothetical protein
MLRMAVRTTFERLHRRIARRRDFFVNKKSLIFIGMCFVTGAVASAATSDSLRVFYGTTPVAFVRSDGKLFVSVSDLARARVIAYKVDKTTNTIVLSGVATSSNAVVPTQTDHVSTVTAMNAALNALATLDSSTTLGVSFADYHSKLIDATVAVQRNLDAASTSAGKAGAPGYVEVANALNDFRRADIEWNFYLQLRQIGDDRDRYIGIPIGDASWQRVIADYPAAANGPMYRNGTQAPLTTVLGAMWQAAKNHESTAKAAILASK